MATLARSCGLALLAAIALPACAWMFPGPELYAPSAGPYDHLPPVEQQRVVRARELLEDEQLERARAVLAEVLVRRPQNMPVGSLLQDVDLLLAESAAGGALSRSDLAREALAEARAAPSPVRLLLAARIAPDPDLARGLMDEALELDPDCAWAHYAVAWSLATQSEWGEARERLQIALLLDPGHLPARRLEAGLMARDADPHAQEAFERWLEISEGNPLVDPAARIAALLDLAQLHLLGGRERRAREVLLSIAEEDSSSARQQCLLAAAEQVGGHRRRALAAAERGAEADPGDPLPVVQQALLLEGEFDDPVAAREAWSRVLELSRESSDLAAVILGMRARVALERSAGLAAAAGAAASDDLGDPAVSRDPEDSPGAPPRP